MAFPGTDPIKLLVRSPSSSCVPHVFEDFARVAERFPGSVAVECCPRAHVDTCTDAELAGFASQVAASLAGTGITSGSRCAILADSDARWCGTYLGVLRLGGIANNLMMPPPAWFWIPSLLVLLPAAYAGGRLVRQRQ
jgi:hypothetical protein